MEKILMMYGGQASALRLYSLPHVLRIIGPR